MVNREERNDEDNRKKSAMESRTLPTAAIPPAITTPDKVERSIGTLEFRDGTPSAATAQQSHVLITE